MQHPLTTIIFLLLPIRDQRNSTAALIPWRPWLQNPSPRVRIFIETISKMCFACKSPIGRSISFHYCAELAWVEIAFVHCLFVSKEWTGFNGLGIVCLFMLILSDNFNFFCFVYICQGFPDISNSSNRKFQIRLAWINLNLNRNSP